MSLSLLAIAVGITQKEVVNKIVEKVLLTLFMSFLYLKHLVMILINRRSMLQFPSSDFVVMLFHYDGFVDEWRDLAWSDQAIHVSAVNQTKW